TNGGGDPYNRLWMSSFSTTTTAYKLIGQLASLRQSNNGLAYGGFQQGWVNNDVSSYRRKFFNDIVFVAIIKNSASRDSTTGPNTALPPGSYSDYLAGLLGGFGISVSTGSGGNNPVTAFTLPAHTVAVWQATATPTAPQVGSIGPTVGQSGVQVTIAGKGFG